MFPEGPRFSAWATALYAALWLILVAQWWAPLLAGDPGVWLEYPDAAAARVTSRELALADAVAAAPPWLRTGAEALYGDAGETLEAAIDIERELLEAEPAWPADVDAGRARLVVLLAEAAEREAALAEGEALPPRLAAALARAYDDPPAVDGEARRAARDAIDQAGLPDWHHGRALRALAGGAAPVPVESPLLRRALSTWVATSLLAAAGLAIVAVAAARRRLWPTRPAAPPWPLADGIGVLVRGDFWSRLYFVALAEAPQHPALADWTRGPVFALLEAWGTLFASLPLLALVWWHLLRPRRRHPDPLGLSVPSVGMVAAVALGALAIDLLGSYAIGWAALGLDAAGHWAEGFDETLVWAGAGHAWLTASDYVVWAPLSEELAFRGLLYFSLRERLGPLTAALASASVFGALHFYSGVGLLMTLWSGLVWALAFERSRSLVPGVLAHSLYNLLYVAGVVLLYR